jgi:hypothetical protein
MVNDQMRNKSKTAWRILFFVGVVAMSIAPIAQTHAQETLTTNRATELRAEADDNAPILQALSAQAKVTLVQRKGAWTKVKTETQTGWVRMMHLRGAVTVEAASTQTKSGGFLSGMNRFLGGSQPNNQRAQSATLGIRGLSPEELKTATPDAKQLAAMNANGASRSDAERFAKEVPLTKTSVADPIEQERGSR